MRGGFGGVVVVVAQTSGYVRRVLFLASGKSRHITGTFVDNAFKFQFYGLDGTGDDFLYHPAGYRATSLVHVWAPSTRCTWTAASSWQGRCSFSELGFRERGGDELLFG